MTFICRWLMHLRVSAPLWYEAPSITKTTLSRHLTPYCCVSTEASRDRNICITSSLVLHWVRASQDSPSDEIAAIMLTRWLMTWSGWEFVLVRVFQHTRLKSLHGSHVSSILMIW